MSSLLAWFFVCQAFSISLGDMTVNLIKAAGYPVEIHNIETPDGYKLKIHRIPHGIKTLHYNVDDSLENSNETTIDTNSLPKESVLIMHGLFCSASMWVIENPEKVLGFMLADAGYDVWMLSARGTTYSFGHKTLQTKSPQYWDFSWHEIGYYDIPTAIDFILTKTKTKKLRYVGHSQGCSVLMVALSMKPNYNQKISSAYLLAPAVYVNHMSSVLRAAIPTSKEIQTFTKAMHVYGVQPRNPVLQVITEAMCNRGYSGRLSCSEILFRVIGGDSGQLNKTTTISTLSKYVVDNVSVKQLVHFSQLVQSGKFQKYDYESSNKNFYGISHPPEYNLSKITAPISILYGTKDALVSPLDVEHLISKLVNVKDTVKLPWNHLDFVHGIDADVRINDYIIRSMKQDVIDKMKQAQKL